MFKKFRRAAGLVFVSFFTLSVMVGCGASKEVESTPNNSNNKAASTAKQEKVILKLGTETAATSPETQGAQKLAELVKQKSNGNFEIQVYESAKLGTMKERVEGMRIGKVDMSTSSAGFLATYVPVAGIFDLPYLYKDKTQEFKVFDGEIGQQLATKLKEQGFHVICYFDMGARHITNNVKPITGIQDLKGLKIRVPQSDASKLGFQALGTEPVQMAFSEVYTALQQNAVDGQENPVSVIMSNKLYEVQKYLSLTNHQLFIQTLAMSEQVWSNLSAENQKILMDSAKEAQAYEREIQAQQEKDLVQQLKDKGMQVNEVADLTPFSEAVKSLRDTYIEKIGQEAKDMFDKIDALK